MDTLEYLENINKDNLNTFLKATSSTISVKRDIEQKIRKICQKTVSFFC